MDFFENRQGYLDKTDFKPKLEEKKRSINFNEGKSPSSGGIIC
jgi:hypothetical protein